MSDKTTSLHSITDNLAETIFEGGASSKNVILPGEVEPDTSDKDKEPKGAKEPKIGGFQAEGTFSAATLLGERLETPEEGTAPATTSKGEEGSNPVSVPSKDGDFNFLIEKGVLRGFEDDSPVKTPKDLEELIKGNKEAWEMEARESAMKELEEQLPPEVMYLVDYAKNGGNDFQSIFKLLSQSQEFQNYDTDTAEGQRALVRAYYSSQNWSDEEIEEEIINLSETNGLRRHAEKLKPKLEKINQDILEQRAAEQEQVKETEKKAREYFTQNVVTTLKKDKLGDLALTKQEKEDIYSALVKEKYNSIGGVTNRLGALLDKIQYIEPNYELLAEVTMLLSDPAAYKAKIRAQENTAVTAAQVKKIKTEQQKTKIGSNHNPDADTKKLPKLGAGFINPFE